MKIDIKFPIIKGYASENYALIIEDFSGITHYFNFDGTYDGYSNSPCNNKPEMCTVCEEFYNNQGVCRCIDLIKLQ